MLTKVFVDRVYIDYAGALSKTTDRALPPVCSFGTQVFLAIASFIIHYLLASMEHSLVSNSR